MSRRALMAIVALVPVAFPALAYEIKSKTPDSAFTAKLQPDIIGLSSNSDAGKARGILENYLKDFPGVKPQAAQKTFGSTNISYVTSLTFEQPAAAGKAGESLTSAFSSPASANLAYYVTRDLGFANGSQPSNAEMIARITGKYGQPTVIGDGHLYYFYNRGKIVSVKQKYNAAAALEALNAPVNPKAAVALNNANGKGSCIAALKRTQAAPDKSLDKLLGEAKGANCDGLLSVALSPGITPDRVGKAVFTLIDFDRITSAAKIDDAAFAAEKNEALNKTPLGNAPKL